MEMLYQTPRDHSPQQSRDRPSQKQTTRYKNRQSRKASKKRGSYGHFDAKTRAAIGKYFCENRVVAAARYYSQALHRPSRKHCSLHQKGLPRGTIQKEESWKWHSSSEFTNEKDCAVVSSLTTAAQSCLHSPLPRSRVFTCHCHAVVSSLALPRSRVFTCHSQWSPETLQCLRNSLARNTMSTM